jgi:ABC-type lipoprotein release transport system permease subunit
MEPMGLQVVDWQQATGIVGQITMVVRAVLLAAIFILFLVTVVILNNSLVMATLERVAEFGTLRAIGAQRGFVNAMVVFETAVLGAIAGTGGALLGVLLISWLGHTGIPAPTDLLQVIFGGPRLYPTVSVGNVVAGLVATFLVSVLATLYPARLATRVQPVVAMQGKE